MEIQAPFAPLEALPDQAALQLHDFFKNAEILAIAVPRELHVETKRLLQAFAVAMGDKLRANEIKHGFADDWLTELSEVDCRIGLGHHIGKDDPRDVAIYAAFHVGAGLVGRGGGHMTTSSLAYLATPYTKYPTGVHGAFVDAARLAGKLLSSGVHVYSPIAHTHPIGLYSGMDVLDLTIWLPVDELMMARCDTLIVAHMPGWQESQGIAHEIEFFRHADKPIFDLDPNTMKMVKRR